MAKSSSRLNKKKKNPNFGKHPSQRTDRELVQKSANKWKYIKK